MSKFLRLSLLVTAILLIIACGISSKPSSTTNTIAGETSPVTLVIQPQPASYTSVDQTINYNFIVTNNSSSALAGPVTVTDDKMTVTCPEVNTVGNKDNNLDPAPNESITCLSTYTITATDIANGTVTDVAHARVGTTDSSNVSAVIRLAENKVLTITVTAVTAVTAATANPATYSGANQQIMYVYTVKNTGPTPVGATQFIVRDDHIPNPILCGTKDVKLATNESVTCNAVYTTTPDDTHLAQIVNTASASGGGAGTIQPANAIVTNTNVIGGGANSGSFTKGSTIQHDVKGGEWMMQIARCYGASIDATIKANPQVFDPNIIYPADRVTVPNIGSVTGIHGPPCVTSYTVKSGDTWNSIASDPNNNAAVDVLMEANRGISLTNGRVLRIPVNSRAYAGLSPVVPATQPNRLNLSASNPTVTVSDSIGTPGTKEYVFTGTAGQLLIVKLSVPTNDINLAIYGPNRSVLKVLDSANSWTGNLTANGDQYIDLVSSSGATKQYKLDVTLTTPTSSPIELVADINKTGNSNVSYLRSYKDQLYFQANANNNMGAELWKYDTGLKALSLVANTDINPGTDSSEPSFLTPFGDYLYFSAKGGTVDNGGRELWRFNGSAVGRVTDINTGPADANPMYLTVYKNALYFSAKGDDKGVELWKYDGATNPIRISDINTSGDSNPAYLAVFNEVLYFSATGNDGKGTELWKYDGNNVLPVADINPDIASSNPAFLTVFNSALYFSASSNDNKGTELWKYDGVNPPVLAADVNPGPAESFPTFLTVFKTELYFSANGSAGTPDFELWKFNGTKATRVVDINPTGSSNPSYLEVHKDELYFQANGGDGAGIELWKYKGP